MTKTEVINAVAKETGLTKKKVAEVLAATVSTVREELVKGGRVQLVGFGTFRTSERAARTGRNPQKPGETITIAAKRVAVFKPGKELKDAVNA